MCVCTRKKMSKIHLSEIQNVHTLSASICWIFNFNSLSSSFNLFKANNSSDGWEDRETESEFTTWWISSFRWWLCSFKLYFLSIIALENKPENKAPKPERLGKSAKSPASLDDSEVPFSTA